jgi:ABC-type lipoprotein export system ATPase subunit
MAKRVSPLKDKIKNLYELINQVDIETDEKNKFYPNIIVTGQSSSGKSSLLESILMVDLFPRCFHNQNVKYILKIFFYHEFSNLLF